jgi:hypothetical protein
MASREPGGYAVTPSLGGRDFHPHRDISCQGSTPLPSIPQSELVSEERIARTDSCKSGPHLPKALQRSIRAAIWGNLVLVNYKSLIDRGILSQDKSQVLERAWPKCGLNDDLIVQRQRPDLVRLIDSGIISRYRL